MFSFLSKMRWKKRRAIDFDIAERFYEHCSNEAKRLESELVEVLDGAQEPNSTTNQSTLERPLYKITEESFTASSRSVLEAHCFALAAAKGLSALYQTKVAPSWKGSLDHEFAKETAKNEVGPENMGHAPNPYPESGGHISYRADVLVGGKRSKQLELIRKYRKLNSDAERVSMLCLALGFVTRPDGFSVEVYEESMRQGNVVGYNLVGHREPEQSDLDEWSGDLVVGNSELVLRGLPAGVREQITASVGGINVFWPEFSQDYRFS